MLRFQCAGFCGEIVGLSQCVSSHCPVCRETVALCFVCGDGRETYQNLKTRYEKHLTKHHYSLILQEGQSGKG